MARRVKLSPFYLLAVAPIFWLVGCDNSEKAANEKFVTAAQLIGEAAQARNILDKVRLMRSADAEIDAIVTGLKGSNVATRIAGSQLIGSMTLVQLHEIIDRLAPVAKLCELEPSTVCAGGFIGEWEDDKAQKIAFQPDGVLTIYTGGTTVPGTWQVADPRNVKLYLTLPNLTAVEVPCAFDVQDDTLTADDNCPMRGVWHKRKRV
jgi:hypothetical protein